MLLKQTEYLIMVIAKIFNQGVKGLLSGVLIATLFACGGGGGSSSDVSSSSSSLSNAGPKTPADTISINAFVIGFPQNGVPSGVDDTGMNSSGIVVVTDELGNPVIDAAVTLNGVTLPYTANYQDYETDFSLDSNTQVTLKVTYKGAVYTATSSHPLHYPQVLSPLSGIEWNTADANTIEWTGLPSSSSKGYFLGLLDNNGQVTWPASGLFQQAPVTSHSFTIQSGTIHLEGNQNLMVGLEDTFSIPNAAANSILSISSFSAVPIKITSRYLTQLTIKSASSALIKGNTTQLSVIGTYSDSTSKDFTSQVTWSLSDSEVVSIDNNGLVKGLKNGTDTLTAMLSDGTKATTVINVFQVNPTQADASQAVSYQQNTAHTGTVVFNSPIIYPTSPSWSIDLKAPISYPIIVGGKVFVTTRALRIGDHSYLYALNESDGSLAWPRVDVQGPDPISGFTGEFIASAYDHGAIFVVNASGKLHSVDADSGKLNWAIQLPGQYSFTSAPTALNGIVYVGGSGGGGTLYAVDETNGNVIWTANVENGDRSSPVVTQDGVYVGYSCQVYKFDPLTGGLLWNFQNGCEGGGGSTLVLANDKLYFRDQGNRGVGLILNTQGQQIGSFDSTPIPAISKTTGFFLKNIVLTAVDLTSNISTWGFSRSNLITAPIVINNTVVVGDRFGNVYMVDAMTGTQVWTGVAGDSIDEPNDFGVDIVSGLAAGDGYLVVPAGYTLTAWKLSSP